MDVSFYSCYAFLLEQEKKKIKIEISSIASV